MMLSAVQAETADSSCLLADSANNVCVVLVVLICSTTNTMQIATVIVLSVYAFLPSYLVSYGDC
jgi:hypothetical protein